MLNNFALSKSRTRRGYALVFTLAVVSLVIVMILGFLESSRMERSSAGSFVAATSARQLADSAVALVQSQINTASTRGPGIAWTSQPGMVRTFDDAGELQLAYKLYSAPDMISASVNLQADLPPAAWRDDTASWVDLNAPISSSGVQNFPILDPAASNDIGTIGGLGEAGLELGSPAGSTVYQPLPMPVRWLYVLKDGQMVAPAGTGRTASISGETALNPIVGRIAFWTDDETSKVNINTAGGGTGADDTFWDVPRASSPAEMVYGRIQPAGKEFQRYPGHLATVALSSVMPGLTLPEYMQLTPRYRHGGSQGGTNIPGGPVAPKGERLYTSLDELMFGADDRAISRLYQDTNATGRQVLESRRFFLTAHSRAPETNLFNLPRIATWPVHRLDDAAFASRTSAQDKLIAFCASAETDAGSVPYLFQRQQSRNGLTNDISIPRNQEVYAYLQALTSRPVPGFGGSLNQKYPLDRDQILTQIYDYIRSTNLYDDTLEEGNQFTSKFTDGVAELSVGHGFVTPSRHPNGTQGFGRFLSLSELGVLFICNARADDPATVADESSGSNVAENLALTANHNPGAATLLQPGERRFQAAIMLEVSGAMQGWALLRPQVTVEITGLEGLNVTVNGVTKNLNLPAPTGNTRTTLFSRTRWNHSHGASMTGEGPGLKPLFFETRSGLDNYGNQRGLPEYPFVGVPFTVTVPDGVSTMSFSGGDLTVKLYSGNQADAAALVQTYQINLPGGDFPIPELATTGTPAGTSALLTSKDEWWSFSWYGVDGTGTKRGRMGMSAGNPGKRDTGWLQGALIRPEFDVLRTVQPAHGDFRLIAALPEVPDSAFAPHRYYQDTSQRMASNLTGFDRTSIPGFDEGATYVPDLDISGAASLPDMPVNATATPHTSRDFDNGIAAMPDGPYINKPDEGNVGVISGDGYFKSTLGDEVGGPTYFTPNRIMPSPGMFGSLPTGVKAGAPWQTLLFRHQPTHPQSPQSRPGEAPDHMLMDLFWMPAIEPYAMSDRFSTAGKINLNYQILPFTYIERSTGLRAVLKSEKLTAIPKADFARYKLFRPNDNPNGRYRLDLDANETLRQFSERFASGEVFISPTEICDIFMVPEGSGLGDMAAFWEEHSLTGDNSRERIYTTVYSKLTTRSNTYTVHFRAQALKKVKGSAPGTWTEGRDAVTGEYRGSAAIERFISPDVVLPDYAANAAQLDDLAPMDSFYRWRTVENRQFAPY